jgi:hypothetical protein
MVGGHEWTFPRRGANKFPGNQPAGGFSLWAGFADAGAVEKSALAVDGRALRYIIAS